MIRNLLSLSLSLCLLFIAHPLFTQSYDASKVDDRLQDEMAQNPIADIPIYILLADRVDVAAMDQEFYEQQATQLERIQQLVPALREKAIRSQTPLIAWMQLLPGVNPHSITTFWVTNAISLEANAEAIAMLSRRSDIEYMGLQGEILPEVYTKTAAPPTWSPDGIEPGLIAIKAPEMWRMGYTGYGRKAMIIDSGVEFAHQSLHVQFWGNNVGIDEAWLDAINRTPQDCGNHGSHVCGTVMGLDRLENDTTGVAHNAHWMASPIFSGDCGGGFSYVIQSFQWAMDPDDDLSSTDDMPDAINNSWRWTEPGNNQCNGVFKSTFDAVEAAGIAIVFSAGNSGSGVSTITSPKNINTTLVNTFATGSLNANVAALPIAGSSSRGPSICGGDSSILIKPEVSAPGVSVRSSVPGGYDFFSGTSMAAPHVTGSVLLLKEAFPELTGTEIKLALYFTARDLGEPGEDNVFGMGIIDVPAAFQYLVDLGNTPELTPRVTDIMLIDMQITDERICAAKGIMPVIMAENGGTDTLHSFEVQYTMTNPDQSGGSFEWIGSLAPGGRISLDVPIDDLPSGSYVLTVRLEAPNGITDDRPLNNQLFAPLEVFETIPILGSQVGADPLVVCKDASAILTSDYVGTGTVQWFNSLSTNPNSLIGSGTHFQTPSLDTTTTFYVDVLESLQVGKEAWSEADDDFTNETGAGLLFDTRIPLVIKSVKVYVEEAGSRFITLKDLDNNLYGEKIVSIATIGESRIPLNFRVPEAEGLVLSLSFGKPLGYSPSGAEFPYEHSDVLTIHRSEGSIPSTSRYFYFYDWEVEYYNACGRDAITVMVSDSTAVPEALFSIQTDSLEWIETQDIQFTDQSTDAENWYWDFGDGTTSTDQNPLHAFGDTGTYVVSLIVENVEGCTDAFFQTVHISSLPVNIKETEVLSKKIKLFPNPARQETFLSFELDQSTDVRISLVDVLGRSVIQTAPLRIDHYIWKLPLQQIETGLYYVKIDIGDQQIIKKIIITQ